MFKTSESISLHNLGIARPCCQPGSSRRVAYSLRPKPLSLYSLLTADAATPGGTARPVRIIYLVQYYSRPDEPGGSRPYQFAKHWSAAGHEVEIVTGAVNHKTGRVHESLRGKMRATTGEDGFTVHRVRSYASYKGSMNKRYLSFFSFALSAVILAPRRPRPDVVFASSTPLTTGLAGVLLSKLPPAPLVFEARDLWPKAALVAGVIRPGRKLRVAEKLESWIYANSRHVVVVSRGDRTELIARGLAPDRVHWVPNGVDDWMLQEEVRPIVRGTGPLEVVYVGAHGRWNHLDRLLDLAKLVGEDVRFTLVGDGDERPRLIERAGQETLRNVRFLEAVPKQVAFEMLQEAHATIVVCGTHAHYQQWLPNKVFDYLAAGRPIFVLGSGELAELVGDGGCGLTSPAGDLAAGAERLKSLAAAGERELDAMGKAARLLARERFARSRLAAQMLDLFRAACEK